MAKSSLFSSKKKIPLKKRIIKWLIRGIVTGALLLFIGFAWFVLWPVSGIPENEMVDEYRYLEQGWGQTERDLYNFTPQGTSMPQGASLGALRYNWFINLELPFSEERFASPDHMRKYRFIVPPQKTEVNPDQLPLGFSRHFNSQIGQNVLDITCAACHNGEIHFKQKNGKRVALRVEGGQAMHAFTDMKRGNFAPVLLASLIYTRANPWKFDRFAKGVLGEHYPQGKDKLKSDLTTSIKKFLSAGQNYPWLHLYPLQEGFGRTDALGRIGNTVFGDHLTSDNYQKGAAPVSYPYLWNIWKFDWVQYNGSVAQPLARNIGEALGVGAVIPLMDDLGNPLPESERFNSSVRVEDLDRIEATLRKLKPPKWPQDVFGSIDSVKAKQGEALFNRFCVECHGPHPASKAQQWAAAPLKQSALDEWLIEVIPVSHVGTDSAAADGFMDRRYDLTKTGITQKEIEDALIPLLIRQLNRNMIFRLREVIRYRELDSIDASVLQSILTQASDPNLADVPEFDSELADKLIKALSEDAQSAALIQSINSMPKVDYNCTLDCQTKQLFGLAKYGYAQAKSVPDSLDIKAMTEGVALNIVGILIKNKYFEKHNLSYSEQMPVQGFGTIDLPQQIRGYKPRPLAGVWATPPFLHNGSVPNVYEMLIPPTERTKEFYLGDREYDPKHLGYVVSTPDSENAKGFLFDTSIEGNTNTGHAFVAEREAWDKGQHRGWGEGVIGPVLSDEERYAIIEFLKVKSDEPECVSQSAKSESTRSEDVATESETELVENKNVNNARCERWVWH